MASNFNPYPNPSPIPPTPHHPKPQTHFSQSPQTLPTDPDPKLVITGGAKLSGHVSISGSKNSALPILAATLCCSGTSKLKNVHNLSDTRTMTSVLGYLGAEIEFSDNEVVVKTDGVGSVEPDPTRMGKFRGGFFVIGPLLARFGEAVVGLPGGCDIGARPVDIYISGLRALGAVVEVRDNKVVAQTANGKRLAGGRFRLDYPSVGATETLMMAACLAEGKTLLSNVAREPEIIDLARFLTKSGAHMEGVGTDKIVIYGKSRLLGAEYGIMPDRIETGSFMLAAAITRSRISLSPVFPGCKLCGTRVLASDLRGGMSIVLAGLAAEGVTEVNGVSHIDRGYENLENKLRLLGADVKRFEFSKSNLQQ
ncbi:hypothetical protein DH2020_011575 [Rehmannia glutinosa]|uniref:UDP-N-acetylglucosamine 1-carboxyvinyltransferase n=1 Tax=Rehmannia glutinosa TaxID=99300 RepID=A0ABR0XDU9_REHGL